MANEPCSDLCSSVPVRDYTRVVLTPVIPGPDLTGSCRSQLGIGALPTTKVANNDGHPITVPSSSNVKPCAPASKPHFGFGDDQHCAGTQFSVPLPAGELQLVVSRQFI